MDLTLRTMLNSHPDRGVGDVPILEAMARDGRYRSQFETGASNGGLTDTRAVIIGKSMF
jgi:Protein of unknown function (DUF3626)